MNIIFTMCFTGSILFLMYLLADKVFKNQLSNHWKYSILKFVLLFFTSPLGLIKLIPSKASSLIDFKANGTLPIMVITSHGKYPNFTYQTNHLIVFIWIIMAVIILLCHLSKYFSFKRLIKQSMVEITDLKTLHSIDLCRNSMALKRKVRIFESSCMSPFTTGILFPLIVLPAGLSAEKQKMIIKHELVHIQRYDTLFLFLRHFVTCFYWFNPLVYLLEKHVERAVEASCDESVIYNLEPIERKNYASLIIDMAAYDIQYQKTYASSFGSSAKNLKERIDLIMTPQKKKRFGKRFSILLAACMVLFTSFTAFAYQPPVEFDTDNRPNNPLLNIRSVDTISFQSGEFKHVSSRGPILYNSQFVDDQGNIYNVENADRSSNSACEHNYVAGTFSKHTQQSGGSCITKYYDAQRCSKCGHLVMGDLIDTETHAVCPH